MKLTPKQQLFCQEYLIDLNAKQAYIRAGYSARSAEQLSSRMMSKDKVRAEIARLKAHRSERNEITADMVIQELALLAFSNPANLFNEHGQLIPINELDDKVSRTISEIHTSIRLVGKGEDAEPYEITKVKQHDKKGSLDLLGKHLGIYEKDNKQLSESRIVLITEMPVEDKPEDVKIISVGKK